MDHSIGHVILYIKIPCLNQLQREWQITPRRSYIGIDHETQEDI